VPMNLSTPIVECLCRLEYMNQEDEQFVGQFVPVQIFGMASVAGSAVFFHCLADDGGIYSRLPVHAFCHEESAPKRTLEDLTLWNSFSYHAHIVQYDLITGLRVRCTKRDKTSELGKLLFTIDWFDDNWSHGFAEVPGQNKCAHFIELDDGNFALLPNNRMRVLDPNFVTGVEVHPRKIMRHDYSSETSPIWKTENSEAYFYDMVQEEESK